MLFQLKKLPEIINVTRFFKSFWILYIDQIIVYNAFYLKLTFYIIKDRCQMHALKVFLHQLSSPHYSYIRKMRRGDRLLLTQGLRELLLYINDLLLFIHSAQYIFKKVKMAYIVKIIKSVYLKHWNWCI